MQDMSERLSRYLLQNDTEMKWLFHTFSHSFRTVTIVLLVSNFGDI